VLIHVACDNDIYPPLFGATQRLFGLARGMAKRARVRALCVVPNRSRGARAETVAGVELRRVKSWHTSVAWWLERGRIAPLFTAESGHRARAERYRRALSELDALSHAGVSDPAERSPDVLMCDLALTGMFPGPGPTLRVYHAHNVEAQRWESSAPPVLGRAGWGARLKALERRAVDDSDVCVACTHEDAELLRSLHGARDVEVVANGFDETSLRPPTAEARGSARRALGIPEQAYVAAFVGGDWEPNHAALAWLIEHILPRLGHEGFVLLAVGAVARRHARTRASWLVTRPETPDLASVLAAADAGLNPVTSGGGSNVKVPTYLALGLAVVSTSFGLRGYAPLAGSVVSAERESFADALHARPRGWAARDEAAPPALADYAWGTLGSRLADALGTRVTARARGAA
jgi:hypothetical protein